MSGPVKRTPPRTPAPGPASIARPTAAIDGRALSTTITDAAVAPSPIDFTSTRGIGAIVIERGNPQVIYVATTTAMLGMTAVRGGQSQITGYPQPRVGLYKTENGGTSWTLIWVPPLAPTVPVNPHQTVGQGDTMIGVRWVKLDPKDPRIVYATAWNNAIHRSAPSLEGGDASFKPIFAIEGRQGFQDLAMFDLTERQGHTRVYAYNGTLATSTQALYRLDNADVPASRLVTGAGASLANTSSWIRLSSNDAAHEGSTSRAICSSQCFYDLVVAVPERRPDTVLLGGVATPTFGEATIRSTDGGVSFSGFSHDAQTPRNSAHVDVRAIVFHPRDPDIAFVGSDGGVVRSDGTFVNISDRCGSLFNNAPQCARVLGAVPSRLYFLNRGLQTLQFYNVALDPRAPLQRMLGGLQDNGTIWQDGTGVPGVWTSVFPFGDGTSASGFHPSRAGVLFASFQSNRYFVNFANGDLVRWLRIDDPIRAANERATITASTGRQFISFDEVNPDTQFTAFQHVWRTKNNGGSQAFLEASCRFSGGSQAATCGDWIPLGVAYPFPAGSNPESASRRPGDLTADAYGADRTGGVVVAAERSALDAGTLWAATSAGRVFVSKNADAAGPEVTFSRIDTPVMPNRFITRIVPDRTDANAAFISYSGFNALTPSAPGHVFRAVFNPSSRLATFTSLDRDLGDLPVNTLAVDDARGDIYAGTDFGALVLRKGSAVWELAGVGFPEALIVDLEFVPSQRVLVAATHGLGIFYLRLDPESSGVQEMSRQFPEHSRTRSRETPTVTIVRVWIPPENTRKASSGGALSVERRPVDGSLLNWIAGFVKDSTNPPGVPRTFVVSVSTTTRVASGPTSARTSMRSPQRSDRSRRRPPPRTTTNAGGRSNLRAMRSDSSIGTSPSTANLDAPGEVRCRQRAAAGQDPSAEGRIRDERAEAGELRVPRGGRGELPAAALIARRRRLDQHGREWPGRKHPAHGAREGAPRQIDRRREVRWRGGPAAEPVETDLRRRPRRKPAAHTRARGSATPNTQRAEQRIEGRNRGGGAELAGHAVQQRRAVAEEPRRHFAAGKDGIRRHEWRPCGRQRAAAIARRTGHDHSAVRLNFPPPLLRHGPGRYEAGQPDEYQEAPTAGMRHRGECTSIAVGNRQSCRPLDIRQEHGYAPLSTDDRRRRRVRRRLHRA